MTASQGVSELLKLHKTTFLYNRKVSLPEVLKEFYKTICYIIRFIILFFILPQNSFSQIILPDSTSLENAKTFTSLEDALLHKDSVYKLELIKQKLTDFPLAIIQFKNTLQVLNLSKNKIKVLPPELGELKNLQRLDLSKNKIEILPAETGQLIHLKQLLLGRNNIVVVPKEISELKQLEILDLWDNDISVIPDEIQHLTNLKVLELRGILFSEQEHNRLKDLLPNTKILLSPSCECMNN